VSLAKSASQLAQNRMVARAAPREWVVFAKLGKSVLRAFAFKGLVDPPY
jgi:hypothetical protein